MPVKLVMVDKHHLSKAFGPLSQVAVAIAQNRPFFKITLRWQNSANKNGAAM